MDYTPISTRRVLVAFALTAFVALLPALYVAASSGGALSFVGNAVDTSHARLLVVGTVVLIAAMIGVLVLVTLMGRRSVRRPARA